MKGERQYALAIRDAIRAAGTSGTGPAGVYAADECNCEWDKMAPSITGNFYIIVEPAGASVGPNNNDGARSRLFHFDITIFMRATHIGRDRQRDLWIEDTKAFHVHEEIIETAVDYNYTTMASANSKLVADGEATGDCDVFIVPTQFSDATKITPAAGTVFAAGPNETVAALMRTLRYRDAHRIVQRS